MDALYSPRARIREPWFGHHQALLYSRVRGWVAWYCKIRLSCSSLVVLWTSHAMCLRYTLCAPFGGDFFSLLGVRKAVRLCILLCRKEPRWSCPRHPYRCFGKINLPSSQTMFDAAGAEANRRYHTAALGLTLDAVFLGGFRALRACVGMEQMCE